MMQYANAEQLVLGWPTSFFSVGWSIWTQRPPEQKRHGYLFVFKKNKNMPKYSFIPPTQLSFDIRFIGLLIDRSRPPRTGEKTNTGDHTCLNSHMAGCRTVQISSDIPLQLFSGNGSILRTSGTSHVASAPAI
jgi:hypothetical protein